MRNERGDLTMLQKLQQPLWFSNSCLSIIFLEVLLASKNLNTVQFGSNVRLKTVSIGILTCESELLHIQVFIYDHNHKNMGKLKFGIFRELQPRVVETKIGYFDFLFLQKKLLYFWLMICNVKLTATFQDRDNA